MNPGMDPATTRTPWTQKAWWVCRDHEADVHPHTHSCYASIYQRAIFRAGCPYCANRSVSPSNSLLALNPNVVGRVAPDPRRHGHLRPGAAEPQHAHVVAVRDESHEWTARVDARNQNKSGCPIHAASERGSRIRTGQAIARNNYEMGNRTQARTERRRVALEAGKAEILVARAKAEAAAMPRPDLIAARLADNAARLRAPKRSATPPKAPPTLVRERTAAERRRKAWAMGSSDPPRITSSELRPPPG